jgi:predicted ATP-binding protein involved in virulence
MKIRKLKIKNYKIFDDVEFDFTDAEGKTLDTIVFAGVNGCGKTTVLEILGQILSSTSIHNSSQRTGSKLASEIELTLNESNENLHLQGYQGVIFQIELPGNRLKLIGGVDGIKAVYFPVSEVDENLSVKILHLTRQKGELKQIVLKSLRDEVFKHKNLPPKDSIAEKIQEVTQALSGIELNTRLVDLESEELIFESANGQRIYFEDLSHGEQNLYFRAIYLSQLNLKDNIIMVDEPEAAFHPTWQQKIAQLYQNVGENNQVFMATHSPHIMASVPPECLFMLHIDESEGKRKIRVINAAKAGKHSQGLEPDRILKEIMQVPLREYQTQQDIDELTQLLTLEAFESAQAMELAEKLIDQLGKEDPFIILLDHELLMLRRKKRTLALAEA